MSPMPSFSNHTVTVVEPGTRTVHGSTVPDWAPDKVTTREIERCLVQPRTTEDAGGGQDPDTTQDSWKILIPGHETPPASNARIRHPFGAGDYQIVGEPLPTPGIREGIDHWFLAVEKWQTSG